MSAAAMSEPPDRHDATPWIPPAGPDSQRQECGVHWDAVRALGHLARPAVELLGDASGAVIRDPYRGDLYWLLPVGAARDWERLPDVEVYGPACFIEVPPRGRAGGPGPYWVVDPADGRLLTHPTALHAALSEAIAEAYPPCAAARLGVER